MRAQLGFIEMVMTALKDAGMQDRIKVMVGGTIEPLMAAAAAAAVAEEEAEEAPSSSLSTAGCP